MNRIVALFGLVLALTACSRLEDFDFGSYEAAPVAEFWRPISEPNLMLPSDKAQAKLAFDMSQCRCGIFPANTLQPDLVSFQPEHQRYVETSVTRTQHERGDCLQRPSLVVSECMRTRGWEQTICSGRMPLAKGGSLCAGAMIDD